MSIQTDKSVLTVACTTFLTFLLLFLLQDKLVGKIGAIWLLYPNVLLVFGWFGYLIWRQRETSQILFHSVLFGFATALTYLPIDWLFSRKMYLIIYRSTDFLANVTTPIGLILTWMVFATLAVYCYHRLQQHGLPRFVASVITGAAAGLGSIVIYGLGPALWEWNALRVGNIAKIATVPVFVPLTFLLTYTLCPYYFHVSRSGAGAYVQQQTALVAGIRCGLFMGALMFLSFLVLYRW